MAQATTKTATRTKKPKKMVSFYADPEVWQALKDWSSKTGSSVGWLARKAITEALIRWKDEQVLLERFRQSLSSQSQPIPPVKSAEQGRIWRDSQGRIRRSSGEAGQAERSRER